MTNKIQEADTFQIMKLMPHRPPFLMIDKVVDIVPGQSGTGIKNVSINEPFFQGHFPDNPIMPGVLQIEAMAQTAGYVILTAYSENEAKNKGVLFMTVDGVKFRAPVFPGDVLKMCVEKMQQLKNVYKFKGEAFVGDKKVSECTFSAMITDKEK